MSTRGDVFIKRLCSPPTLYEINQPNAVHYQLPDWWRCSLPVYQIGSALHNTPFRENAIIPVYWRDTGHGTHERAPQPGQLYCSYSSSLRTPALTLPESLIQGFLGSKFRPQFLQLIYFTLRRLHLGPYLPSPMPAHDIYLQFDY